MIFQQFFLNSIFAVHVQLTVSIDNKLGLQLITPLIILQLYPFIFRNIPKDKLTLCNICL
ncbi:hypothetical protein T636_A0634 [Enterobacter hormaechei subsp. xiangfangensis]|nr:hypothetical protein T636_A0634 [Enterobacter hormaechei subsp. xiangfangensis]KLR16145.1 hypothetical protein ABR28_19755 [Enterobacter hormaechei subsp. hoffmannii]